MTQRGDPLTVLQRANPVPLDRLSEASTSTVVHALYEEIVTAPPPLDPGRLRRLVPRPARRRRRRLVGTLLAVAIVSVGWRIYVASTQPTKPLTVACYATADASAHTEVLRNDGRPQTDICAGLWRQGAFGPGPVPPLVACVAPSGLTAVVPGTGSDACRQLGAGPLQASSSAPPVPSTSATAPDPLALRDSLADAFTATCVSPERAREIASRELAARGFAGWTVEATGTFSDERPCTSLGVDVPEKEVRLIPTPPPR
jgi:hypothetical protein